MRVLIVEDDEKNATEIRHALIDAGYQVELAFSGFSGLKLATSGAFDVVILDRMLQDIDGLEVLAEMRKRKSAAPVLILSALSAVNDRVEGLRAGGDDYLAKPFEFSELAARVHALLRRSRAARDVAKWTVGRVSIDLIARNLIIGEETVKLLPKEFSIVEFLMKHPDVPMSRKMIFEAVWGYRFNHESAALDVHISKIRKKIEAAGGGAVIQSVRNVGFVFRAN